MTAELPPTAEPIRHPRREDTPTGYGDNVALIAVIAFVFGVFLNGYIALSVLNDSSGSGSPAANDAPEIVPAAATAVATATATPLPDRTSCAEIAGTEYRSGAEREFYLTNCINQPEVTPTENPDAPALDGGSNTDSVDPDSTPTPEP